MASESDVEQLALTSQQTLINKRRRRMQECNTEFQAQKGTFLKDSSTEPFNLKLQHVQKTKFLDCIGNIHQFVLRK